MGQETLGYKLAVFLAFGGITSGLLTSILAYPREETGSLGGLTFGVFLTVQLMISGILRNPLKAFALVAATTAAYFLADIAAFGFQLHHPELVPSGEWWSMGTAEPPAAAGLFVGGLVGGFVVFAAALSLCGRGISKRVLAKRIIQGALLGGALGVLGWALRSSVGVGIWHVFHAFGLTPSWERSPRQWFGGNPDYGARARMYSVYVVWQSGVATALGLILGHISIQRHDKATRLSLLNP